MRPPTSRYARAEHVRQLLSPAVALLGSSLFLCCLVTLPDVALGWPALLTADARIPGWTGVVLVLAFAGAALSLLSSPRLGSAPPLALGTTTAVLGLALSGDVSSGPQAVLAMALLAVGAGTLFAFGLCQLEDLPSRVGAAALLGWVVPVAGGWGVVGWLALHGRTPGETRLGLHPPVVVLGAAAAALLGWALFTLVLDPEVRPATPRVPGWENAWAALTVLVVGAGTVVMLVGFQAELAPSWGRPVVLLVAAIVAGGLVLCGAALPEAAARPAYVAVVVSAATGPACVHVLLLVSSLSASLSGAVLVVLALAGVIGVWIGWWRSWWGCRRVWP